ncbi:indoleglycerol phosphate synthase, partial [mine drainage metagenome]
RESADVPADVFAVNVRDLDSLELRRDVAAETIRAVADRRPLLGMSGVDGPRAARAFWDLGVDAILVGSAVARARDPAAFVRALVPADPRGGSP